MSVEKELTDYLKYYFSEDERKIMDKAYFHDYMHNDCTFNDPEYKSLINKYKIVLGIKDDDFRIEVDKSGRIIIQKLLKEYVTDDTFFVVGRELLDYVAKDVLATIKNKYIIRYCIKEHLKPNLIEDILIKFKASGAKKVFVLLPSVCPCFGYSTLPETFVELKLALTKLNVPNIFILDDCQGALYRENKLYDMFDGILITAHVLFPNFLMGILITKLKKQIGFSNKQGLKRFYDKLEILARHKDKANKFQDLIYEFFKDILSDKIDKPDVLSNSHQGNFIFSNFDIANKTKAKIRSEYGFSFNSFHRATSWFRIRLHESLIQDPEHIIKGLKVTKKVIQHQLKKMELDRPSSMASIKYVEEKIKSDYSFYKRMLDAIQDPATMVDTQIQQQGMDVAMIMGYLNKMKGKGR